MAKKRSGMFGGGWKTWATALGLGAAVGVGLSSIAQKLPFVGNFGLMIGAAGAYAAAGTKGVAGYVLATNMLGDISGMLGGITGTPAATGTGATF